LDPGTLGPFAASVIVGALLGSHLGARKPSPESVRGVLAVVLAVAAGKRLLGLFG